MSRKRGTQAGGEARPRSREEELCVVCIVPGWSSRAGPGEQLQGAEAQPWRACAP